MSTDLQRLWLRVYWQREREGGESERERRNIKRRERDRERERGREREETHIGERVMFEIGTRRC